MHGYSFENFFKTGRKGRYDLKFSNGTQDKQKPTTGPDDAISGGDRPFPRTPSTKTLESFCNTLNYIY